MTQWGEILDVASRAAGVVASIAALGFGYLMLRLKTVFATKHELNEQITPLKKQTDENTKAIAAIEGVLENLPDAKDVEDLRLAIERLNGELKVQAATNEGLRDALDRTTAATSRIESFLMTKGK